MSRLSIKDADRVRWAKKAGRRRRAARRSTAVRIPPSITSASQGLQAAFANKQRCTLRFLRRVYLGPGGTGTGDYHSFRANSLFDPDYTTAGSQPTGFDQYAALYQHYRVLSSTCQMNIVNTSGQPVIAWCELSGTPGSLTAPELPLTRGRAAYKTLSPTGGNDNCTLTNVYDGVKFFGKSFWDRDHQAAVGGNPGEDVFFNTGFAPVSESYSGATADMNVVIIFEVEFSEPAALPVS